MRGVGGCRMHRMGKFCTEDPEMITTNRIWSTPALNRPERPSEVFLWKSIVPTPTRSFGPEQGPMHLFRLDGCLSTAEERRYWLSSCASTFLFRLVKKLAQNPNNNNNIKCRDLGRRFAQSSPNIDIMEHEEVLIVTGGLLLQLLHVTFSFENHHNPGKLTGFPDSRVNNETEHRSN